MYVCVDRCSREQEQSNQRATSLTWLITCTLTGGTNELPVGDAAGAMETYVAYEDEGLTSHFHILSYNFRNKL